MNTKLVLLEIGKKDLQAARYLFLKELFPQAIFYLQQAIEKAAKSMGLYHNIIDEDDLEEIGHKSVEVYIRVINELKNKVKRIHRRIKEFPKLKSTTLIKKYRNLPHDEFGKMLDNFEFYLKHPNKNISNEELEKTISQLSELESEIENRKIPIKKEEIENTKLLVKELADVIAEERPVSPKVEKELKKLESLKPESLEEYIMSLTFPQAICNLYLLHLSVALCPHAVSSRYPFPKSGHNPSDVYTKEHPLIKKFNQLADSTERVMERMLVLFSSSERLKSLIETDEG